MPNMKGYLRDTGGFLAQFYIVKSFTFFVSHVVSVCIPALDTISFRKSTKEKFLFKMME
jgi:hypothetical protein